MRVFAGHSRAIIRTGRDDGRAQKTSGRERRDRHREEGAGEPARRRRRVLSPNSERVRENDVIISDSFGFRFFLGFWGPRRNSSSDPFFPFFFTFCCFFRLLSSSSLFREELIPSPKPPPPLPPPAPFSTNSVQAT